MKRREVIRLLGGLPLACPVVARAQEPPIPRIGFLHPGSPEPNAEFVTAFRDGLAETHYVEGQNVAIEFRWADGHYDRLSELVIDLLHHDVAIIVAFGNVASRIAKAANASIPVAFASGGDPVAVGLVTSLARPDANMTGVSILNQELDWARLERLLEVVPHTRTIAFLVNPDSLTTGTKLREMQSAARMLGRRMQVVNACNQHEFETAFATIDQRQISAMLVASDSAALSSARRRSAALSAPISSSSSKRLTVSTTSWRMSAMAQPSALVTPG